MSAPFLAAYATLISLVPAIWATVANVGRAWTPLGDYAVIDIRARDAGLGHLPLLGMYSRFGWYHPGPAMFWLLAPFSRVTGGAAWATLVGCAVLQGVAIVAAAFLAWRRGRLQLVLAVLAVIGLSYVALRNVQPFLRPWTPYVDFPLFVVFLLLVWSVGLGELGAAPWVAVVGSLLVQIHVGYALLVAGGIAWCVVVGFGAALIRSDRRRAIVWPVVVSLAVTVVLWLPTLIEQFRSGGGNLKSVIDFMRRGNAGASFNFAFTPERPPGLTAALGVFAAEFRWLPAWLGGSSPFGSASVIAVPVSMWWLVPAIVLLGAAAVGAARARNRDHAHALVLVAVMAVLCVVSISGVRGGLTDFAFYWRITIAVMLVAVCLATPLAFARVRTNVRVQIVTAFALVGVVIASSVATAMPVARGDHVLAAPSVQAAQLAHELAHLVPPKGRVLLAASGDTVGTQFGLFDALVRGNSRVALPPTISQRYLAGTHETNARTAAAVWCLVTGTEISQLSHTPGGRRLAIVSPFSRANEASIEALQSELIPKLDAAHESDLVPSLDSVFVARRLHGVRGIDPAAVGLLARFLRAGTIGYRRYAVFAVDRADIPAQCLAA